MAHFMGTHNGITVSGEIAAEDVRPFVEKCRREGWTRLGVGEGPRIVAAVNQHGVWVHEDMP